MEYTNKLQFVKDELQRRKGSWSRISRMGDVSYFTIQRVAREISKEPRPSTIDRIYKALALSSMEKSPAEKAVDFFGGVQAELARACNVTPQAITKWMEDGIPTDRALEVEEATKGAVTAREILEAAKTPPSARGTLAQARI